MKWLKHPETWEKVILTLSGFPSAFPVPAHISMVLTLGRVRNSLQLKSCVGSYTT
jgi:hypothetical protein